MGRRPPDRLPEVGERLGAVPRARFLSAVLSQARQAHHNAGNPGDGKPKYDPSWQGHPNPSLVYRRRTAQSLYPFSIAHVVWDRCTRLVNAALRQAAGRNANSASERKRFLDLLVRSGCTGVADHQQAAMAAAWREGGVLSTPPVYRPSAAERAVELKTDAELTRGLVAALAAPWGAI